MANKSNATTAMLRNMAATRSLDDSDEVEPTPATVSSPTLSNYAVKQIPFELLEPNRFQIQLRPGGADEKGLQELAQNMTVNGFTSTILVRPVPNKPGYYELGYGHRRLQALKIAAELEVEPNKVRGWNKIPARIAENATDTEWLDIAISENLSREDLTPLAIANSFQAIRSQTPGVSLADIAHRVGRSKSWVQRYDAINGAPDHLVKMIDQKHNSLEHLFILKSIPNPTIQRDLAQGVVNGELTLNALKELVEILKSIPNPTIQRDLAQRVVNGELTLNALKELVENKRNPSQGSATTRPKALKDTVIPDETRLNRLLIQLDITIQYLGQQLERENYQVSFDQQDRIENSITKLKEISGMTRPKASK